MTSSLFQCPVCNGTGHTKVFKVEIYGNGDRVESTNCMPCPCLSLSIRERYRWYQTIETTNFTELLPNE